MLGFSRGTVSSGSVAGNGGMVSNGDCASPARAAATSAALRSIVSLMSDAVSWRPSRSAGGGGGSTIGPVSVGSLPSGAASVGAV